MMLVRPPMTNLKMTVRDDRAVSACSTSLPSPLIPPPARWLASENKASFPVHRPGLFVGFWAMSSWAPHTPFSNLLTLIQAKADQKTIVPGLFSLWVSPIRVGKAAFSPPWTSPWTWMWGNMFRFLFLMRVIGRKAELTQRGVEREHYWSSHFIDEKIRLNKII